MDSPNVIARINNREHLPHITQCSAVQNHAKFVHDSSSATVQRLFSHDDGWLRKLYALC